MLTGKLQELLNKLMEILNQPLDYIPEGIEPETPYRWDKYANIVHSFRKICDEYGLNWAEKSILCAVIESESSWNPKAVCKNRYNTDYGLFQYNDYWYRDLITVDQAINDMEFGSRLFIKRYNEGKINDWWGFRAGRYKRYLNKWLNYKPMENFV